MKKKQYIEDILAIGDLEYILESNYEKISKNEALKKLIDTLHILKKNILIQSDFEETNVCLCHMNLNHSNVIFRNGMYKFLNLENCYNLSPMWDIAHMSINLNLHGFVTLEKKFFDFYKTNSKNNFDLDYDVLQDYKSMAFKLQFYKLLCDYIYKTVLMDDKKSLLDIFSKYQELRGFVKNEMSAFLMFLDDIFYNVG